MKVVLKNTPATEKSMRAAYMREWRSNMTAEQKLKYAELSKIRMKNYRQRTTINKNLETPRTRLEEKKIEERKRIDREKKAKYRSELSSQKKRRIKEKDARCKREKRAALKLAFSQQSESQSCSSLQSENQLSSNRQSDSQSGYIQQSDSQSGSSQQSTNQSSSSHQSDSQSCSNRQLESQSSSSQWSDSQSGSSQPPDSQPGSSQPPDSQPGSSQQSTNQSSSGYQSDSQSCSNRQLESQSSSSQWSDSQSGSSQPPDSQPGSSQSQDSQPGSSQQSTNQSSSSHQSDSQSCSNRQLESQSSSSQPPDSQSGSSQPPDSQPGSSLSQDSQPGSSPQSTNQSSSSHQSAAFKKYVYRHCKMPKSPHKYARVVKRLTTNVTPRRRAALESEGILNPEFCKKNLTELMEALTTASTTLKGRSTYQKEKKKSFFKMFKSLRKSKETQRLFCRATGIKKKYLSTGCLENNKRKKRSDALPIETEKSIIDFFEDETNSTSIPDTKSVHKDLQPKKVMQTSLDGAFKKWSENNEDRKASYTTFCKLKPNNVLTQKHRKLFQCLCEYCENVKLKLKCLSNLANKEQVLVKEYINNEFSAVKNSLCMPTMGEKSACLKCVDRKCKECGTWLLKQKLQPILSQEEVTCTWLRWEKVKTVNPKTKAEITKQQMVTKSGTLMLLWDELDKELDVLSVHLFEAKWQQEQFSILHRNAENFPEKTLSLTMDFAENFTCFSQNEIQAAHWAQDSVTLHPVIARYQCPNDECHELVEECIDIVSDDLQHDCHAVHTFTEKIFQYVKDERNVEVDHAIVISDGCAAQYKSKVPFMDVSYSLLDFNVSMERSYYGSRHGKNRCDGEAGVVKSMARRAIIAGAVIKNARSFFDEVKKLEISPSSSPCTHKLRKFIFVASTDIIRERPLRNAKTVPGTRKVHSVRGVSKGKVLTRRLSCFCSECLGLRFGSCQNSKYVDEWKPVTIKSLIQANVANGPESPDIPSLAVQAPLYTHEEADLAPSPIPNEILDLDFIDLDNNLNISPDDDLNMSISPNCSFSEIDTGIAMTSYIEGTFIKVQHGSELYPAVPSYIKEVLEEPEIEETSKPKSSRKRFLIIAAISVVLIGLVGIISLFFVCRYYALRRHMVTYRYSLLNQTAEQDFDGDLEQVLTSEKTIYEDSDEEDRTSSRPSMPNGRSASSSSSPKTRPLPNSLPKVISYHDDSDVDMLE